ncbi:ferritin-like domain-containing protein [Nocardia sp. NPDC050710]|uniref:ferritin-like domain-containing protein n=1 Tax=Nocardia sp. NPDC050710 TaxID=3157220 RepID=UPI0033CC072D
MESVQLGKDATDGFGRWTREFEAKTTARTTAGDPEWGAGARLDPAVVRSVQRFQVGESGDGANLIAKAERAGDPEYAAAVRLFVAEERNHARLLELLLRAAGAPTIASHWTDAIFVRLRRALGLRMELMVLMIAEVVALQYYRLLREGTSDPLTTQVAGLILNDEKRHVPFHCQRLRMAFGSSSRGVRWGALVTWWVLLIGASVVVAVDHGPALGRFGCRRSDFVRATVSLFAAIAPTVIPSGSRR